MNWGIAVTKPPIDVDDFVIYVIAVDKSASCPRIVRAQRLQTGRLNSYFSYDAQVAGSPNRLLIRDKPACPRLADKPVDKFLASSA